MPAKERIYLGIDIGGTKVAAGMVTARGKILSKVRVPMSSRGSDAEGLDAVERAIDAAFEREPKRRASVAAIGISSPGPLDPRKGIIINPPNLPCWQNFPLAARVQRLHHVPTFVDNDANAGALAEAMWGAGRGYESVFYATLGTGIGTGVILGGQIYHGRTGQRRKEDTFRSIFRDRNAHAGNLDVLKRSRPVLRWLSSRENG